MSFGDIFNLTPIPLWQSLATYLSFTAIIIGRYFAIVWPIHWALWKRTPKRARRLSKREPTRETIRNEIKLSTISAFIYALPAALVIEVWKAGGSALYMSMPADIWGWLYLPLSGLIYLFVQDLSLIHISEPRD